MLCSNSSNVEKFKYMKKLLTILLIFYFDNCFCQNLDYKIYSIIINNYFTPEFTSNQSNKIVILERYKTAKYELNQVGEDIEVQIDELTKRKIKKMFSSLKKLPKVSSILKIDSFMCKIPLVLCKNNRFDSLFLKTNEDLQLEKLAQK